MEPGRFRVSRDLPIDANLLRAVLLVLRRDAGRRTVQWTLGDRGAAEVDLQFVETIATSPGHPPAWATSGRLWDPEHLALLVMTVTLQVHDPDSCRLELAPDGPLTPWWEARLPALLDLAHAALDELAEEMLWHATRPDITRADR